MKRNWIIFLLITLIIASLGYGFLAQDKKEQDKFNTINTNDIINLISLLEVNHIWDYLKEAISQFQSTIYATYLIDDNDNIKHNIPPVKSPRSAI